MVYAIQSLSKRKATMKNIRKVASDIAGKYHPQKILLFGSAAYGKAGPDSDVDLMIIMDTKGPAWEKAVEISTYIRHDFPIDIIVKTPREVKQRIALGDYFIQEIVEKGKVLYG